MRVIIPTRAHFPRMRAHRLFKPSEVSFVVDDEATAQKLMGEDGPELLSPGQVHVTGILRQDHGLSTIARIRDWISQELLEDGEWALLVDDNVGELTRVSDEYYQMEMIQHLLPDHSSNEWRQIFATPADPWELASELKAKCEELGTIMGGLAAEPNYFYRTTKWSLGSYTKAKFAVWRNDRSLPWYAFDKCMFEDFVMTAQVIAKYGCVANNRFARMDNPYFEPGGIGSYKDRHDAMMHDCAWLVEHYPGLVKYYKDKKCAVTFKLHSRSSIERWRREHGYAS